MAEARAPVWEGSERFALVRRLGEGGTGIVYEALDRARGTRVALKTLREVDPQSVALLKHEFRVLQDVRHPNLVTLLELVQQDSQWFFTMELVDGLDVLAWIRGDAASSASVEVTTTLTQQRPDAPSMAATQGRGEVTVKGFDEPRLRDALRQLARGLDALHRAGRVHRDIKAGNVLVNRQGHLVIVDFGLVTSPVDARDRAGRHLPTGTVATMSPEQAAGGAVGPSADLYAVGVLLYQALTGRLPFDGRPFEILADKQRRDPVPPQAIVLDLPADLASLCMTLLARDPICRPGCDELLARLSERRATRPRPRALNPAPPFVGRDRELALLAEALAEVETDRPVIALCSGAPGVGKTALLRRFLETLEGTDRTIVLTGRCYERETAPFKAIDGMIDALCGMLRALPASERRALAPPLPALLGSVFPEVRALEPALVGPEAVGPTPFPGAPAERRAALFAGVREWLRAIGEHRRLVLAIDDLHWADADSLALLEALVRPPEAPALLLLATARSSLDRDGDPFRTLGGDVRHVVVDDLEPAQARVLCRRLLDELPGAHPDEGLLVDAARGNPLALHEMVRTAVRFDGATSMRASVQAALGTRITGLAPDARALLDVLVVAGGPLPTEVALRAAALASGDEAIAALRRAHLVGLAALRGGQALETQHDLVREVAAALLAAEERTALHGRIARALEAAAPDQTEAMAIHFQAAGEHAQACRHARAAAEDAEARLAFDRAVRLYRLADWAGNDGPSRGALARRLGEALANAGRGAEAAASFLTAAEGKTAAGAAEQADALDLRRRAAEQFLRAGRIDEGVAVLREVLADVGISLPGSPLAALTGLAARRAQVMLRGLEHREVPESQVPPATLARIDACWSAAIGLGMADLVRGAYFQTLHLLQALEAGEPYRLARAFAVEAPFRAATGPRGARSASRLCEKAEAMAQRSGKPHALGLAAATSGLSATQEGRWRAAQLFNERALGIFRERCTGVAWEITSSQVCLFWSLAYLGDLEGLALGVPRRYREAVERGDVYAATNLAIGPCSLPFVMNDDPEGGRRHAREAMSRWSRGGFHVQHCFALHSEVLFDLYQGDARAAHERLLASWPALARSQLLRNQLLRITSRELLARATLARAAQEPARRGVLLPQARRLARQIAAEGMAWSAPLARTLEAGVAALRGKRELAGDLLAAAAIGFEAADMAFHAAAARHGRAALVGGDEGRALREGAVAWLGSRWVRKPDAFFAAHLPFTSGPAD